MAKRSPSNLSDSFISVDSNLDELAGKLDKFEQAVEESVLLSGVAAMARVLYNEVKLNTAKHKKTGLLDSAVYRFFNKNKSTDLVKIYDIGVNKVKAPHWHFLEYGTSKEEAKPYIRPAFDHIQEAIQAGKDRMSERLAEGVVPK